MAKVRNTYDPDSQVSKGLLSAPNSLSHRVAVIQRHLHSPEEWYGAASAGSGNATRKSFNAWDIVTSSTANTYGAEVQLHDGTVFGGGSSSVYFDMHRMLLQTSSANSGEFLFEFYYGTGTFAGSTLLTEILFVKDSSSIDSYPVEVQCPTISCNNKIWCRAKKSTSGAANLGIHIGLHTYPNT